MATLIPEIKIQKYIKTINEIIEIHIQSYYYSID